MTGNRLTDLLYLSIVPRWGIVDHIKPQTVGDHTFRVMVIYTELAHRLDFAQGISVDALMCILHHDAAECRTGDVPTPAKKMFPGFDTVAEGAVPWYGGSLVLPNEAVLITIADLIEATTFIRRYGIGPHSQRVETVLCSSIKKRCPADWQNVVWAVMREINEDAGR